jgi:ABC-type amino acid transport substrate-binding protein
MKLKLKILTVAFVSLLLLSSGCAQINGNTTNASASSSPVIDRILQRGELVVGMAGNMPPMNMTTKAGELIGYEVDLAKNMAGAMGVSAKFSVMHFAELLPALQSGKIDLILSNMTITPARNLNVAFLTLLPAKHF